MSDTITVEQGGSTRSINAADRFAAIVALLEKGSSLSRTIRVNGSETEQIEIIRVESRSAERGEWKPWFPVIDYDRCTNCMQCLSFCLFGVYGVDAEKRIQVQNQDKCKTNCPACSRVCPEAAIMFPKYKSGPINGDAVSAGDLRREKMKVDISSLLGGDVFQMLRDRSQRAQSRFSKERDADKALKERQKCLAKLARDGRHPARGADGSALARGDSAPGGRSGRQSAGGAELMSPMLVLGARISCAPPTTACSGSSSGTSGSRECSRSSASSAGSGAASISRRFSISRSSTAATCAARAAGWMSSRRAR